MAKNQKKINPEDAIRQSLVTHEADFLVDKDSGNHRNLFYGLEMYVPDCYGTDKGVVRQLLGNFGCYANAGFSNDVQTVMLDDRVADSIMSGNLDIDTKSLCKTVGKRADSLMFVRESSFLKWASDRVKMFPDRSSIELLDILCGESVDDVIQKHGDEMMGNDGYMQEQLF